MTDLPKPETGIRRLVAPPNIPRARYVPPIEVATSDSGAELPLVGGENDVDQKKLQEVWKAKTKVFKLPDDNEEYECIWQAITDGQAHLAEHQTNWDPNTGCYVALLRWVALEYKLPQDMNRPQ